MHDSAPAKVIQKSEIPRKSADSLHIASKQAEDKARVRVSELRRKANVDKEKRKDGLRIRRGYVFRGERNDTKPKTVIRTF